MLRLASIVLFIFLMIPSAGFCTPRVLATVLPVWAVAQSVAGFDVDLLVPPGAELHDLALRPSDMVAISRADVVFKNGAGLEGHLESALGRARRVVDLSRGLDVIRLGDGSPDPHIWLDPQQLSKMAYKVAAALSELDPQGAAGYSRRAGRLSARLRALDSEISLVLVGIGSGRVLVTYHESFNYFARRYGLRAEALTGPGMEAPMPRRIAEIYRLIGRGGALFYEPGVPRQRLEAIARETGARLCPLDTLESGREDDDYYFSAMRANLTSILECLGGGI